MAHRPTNLPSLAAAMVEDATKAFARDDGAPLSEAVLRHYRSATRAAVLAAVRRLARGTTDMPGSGISLEKLAAELASAERPTLQAVPLLPE